MLLTEDMYAALGRVAANFQLLEAVLLMTSGALISDEHRIGQIVTSQLSFSRLCTTLDALVRHRTDDKELLERLDELLRAASSAEEKRNSVLHSIYLGSDEAIQSAATSAKIVLRRGKGIQILMKDLDAVSVEATANEILQVWQACFRFMTELETRGLIALPAI